jgi:hypothetical protein
MMSASLALYRRNGALSATAKRRLQTENRN